ncbi:MAG TPA: alpha-amylase domain-containing protein [Planctomycetota bacterium]|nr:alpha-amylase domain-containing protein [Planctomycetota bacterium]
MKANYLKIGVSASLTIAALAFGGSSAQRAVAGMTPNGPLSGIMIEGFGWNTPLPQNRSWWDHLSDKAPELARLGVTGIWAPPACKGAGGGFSDGYDVYDYYDLGSKNQMGTVATKWGTKEQYLQFIACAHANGLDVYADAVTNQRCGGQDGGPYYPGTSYDSLVGSEAEGRLTMGPWDFHADNSSGDWNVWIAGLPDVAQENPATKTNLFNWIRWYDQQTGVDGYRVDAAKNMPFDYQEGFMYQFQEGMGPNRNRFVVSEYYDGNPNNLEYYVNAVNRRASVFDYELVFNIHSVCHGNGFTDMSCLRGRFFDDQRSVTFVNNHDTEGRGNGMDTFIRANLGYAFIMCIPGYPCIYWPDLYDQNDQMRPYFQTCCWVHAVLAKGPMIERWCDNTLYILERQGNLLAGFNSNAASWRSEWVPTTFGANVHLHDYSGQLPDQWTDSNGWAYVNVPPSGYVFWGVDGYQGFTPNPPPRRTTQQTEGNYDMDTLPAQEKWSQPVKIISDAGQPIHIDLYLQDTTLTPFVCLLDKDGNRLNHAKGANGHVSLDYNNPPAAGWYQIRVGLLNDGKNTQTPSYLKVTYQAPKAIPDYKNYPDPTKIDLHVLPLVATSVGP